jgi:hypothetical protein
MPFKTFRCDESSDDGAQLASINPPLSSRMLLPTSGSPRPREYCNTQIGMNGILFGFVLVTGHQHR